MPYNGIYVTLGGPFSPMLVKFVDEHTYFAWQNHFESVKALNAQGVVSGDYQPFLDGVRNLRAFWGGILVPEDVKSALGRVEIGLGLPLTQWEQGERYHSPTVVDATHFGPFPQGFVPPADGNNANNAGVNDANDAGVDDAN
jgi:hypothetical protein